jgi:hypothetical protein
MVIRRLYAVALAITMLSGAGRLAADGCFMRQIEVVEVQVSPDKAAAVTSPKQEAILATEGRRVQVVLRTHFDQGPRELAWVVPVPAQPTKIRTCDGNVFAGLDELTKPRFFTVSYSSYNSGPHLSFGCDSPQAFLNSKEEISAPLAVHVESEGTAGMYEYAVLSSENAGDLEKWLHRHNYAVPKGAAEVFKKYTDKGWHWLAMRVRAEATTEQVFAPRPITYTYQGELTFPLVISTLSAADETEIVLYLVGKTNFDTANWNSMDLGDYNGMAGNHNIAMPQVLWDLKSPSGTTYESGLRELTKTQGGHLFMRELCEQWQLFGHAGMGRRFDDVLDAGLIDGMGREQRITRLRAFVKRADMDQDVQFVTQKKERQIQNLIYIMGTAASRGSTTGAWFLCLLPLAGLGAAWNGRRNPRLRLVNVLLALTSLMLMMM